MRKTLKMIADRIVLATLTMVVTVAIVAPSTLLGADRPVQKINVAYSSISGNIAPLWVTQDKVFFASTVWKSRRC